MHIKKRVENGKNASASEQREQATEREREAKGQREREKGRGTEEAVLTASQSCVRAAEEKGALQQRLLTEQTHVG